MSTSDPDRLPDPGTDATTDDATTLDGPDSVGSQHDTVEVGASTADPEPDQPAGRKRSRLRRIALGVGVALVVVLAVVAVLAIWPASSSGLMSRPDPTSGYDEALARFDEVTVDEAEGIWEPCRSKLLTHGTATEVVVVLFHGLTNCPEQYDEFAAELFAGGANVLVLRAPHHGAANRAGDGIGSVSNAGGLTAGELRDFADDSVDIAIGLGEEVRVLGLSMGGVLASWVGQERADVDRVVAVAPAMSIPGLPSAVTTAFVNFFDKIPNVDLPGQSKLDHAYAGETTKGLVATFLLARATDRSARARGPAAGEVVVVVNPDDNQVDAGTVTAFAERWGAHDGDVDVVELPFRGLPHDVIDPDQPAGNPSEVYPFLQSLLAGDAP